MQPDPNQPSTAIGALDDDISDEEANAEIDIPIARPANRAGAAPTDKTGDNEESTPSVRKAIDKAAELLKEIHKSE
jgi:hypothetical protein